MYDILISVVYEWRGTKKEASREGENKDKKEGKTFYRDTLSESFKGTFTDVHLFLDAKVFKTHLSLKGT